MKRMKRLVYDAVCSVVIMLASPPAIGSSWSDMALAAFAGEFHLTTATFFSRLHQTYGAIDAAYEAVANAGWASDALEFIYWTSPIGSSTEWTSYEAWAAAEDATTALYMMYVGDWSYLDPALVALWNAQVFASATAYYVGQHM